MAKVTKKTKAVAKKTAKPVAKKPATKAKPVIKKAPAKPAKKVVAKAKPAPKKATVKAKVKPIAKAKPAPKKAPAKAAKKIVAKAKPAPKKTVAKAAPKKAVVKKATPKPAVKKAAPKPVAKKVVEKPVVKKTEPKAVAKPAPRPIVQKAQPVVQKHINHHDAKPLMEVSVVRYKDADLAIFKEVILKKIAKAKEEIDFYSDQIKNTSESETQFASIDDGSMTSERENMNQIVVRMQKLISHLESALVRIENKSYGICRETGRLIPKERLLVVPHATLSVEGKKLEKK